MNLLETLKSLNPLKKLVRSPSNRVANALRAGQALGDAMRDASDAIAQRAVREALEEFSDGPAALFITCLIEASTDGWTRLGTELRTSSGLPPESAAWVSARFNDYGRSMAGEVISQHLINLVLSVTGLHVEALILTREEIDAAGLTVRLAGLLKQGLSSSLPRAELSQTLASARNPASRLASAN